MVGCASLHPPYAAEPGPRSDALVQQRAQAVDRLGDLLRVAGKAEAQITLAHRPEGVARREADFSSAKQLLREGEAIGDPVDPAAGLEAVDRHIARCAAARDKPGDERLALSDRDNAGVLQEGRRAAGV